MSATKECCRSLGLKEEQKTKTYNKLMSIIIIETKLEQNVLQLTVMFQFIVYESNITNAENI